MRKQLYFLIYMLVWYPNAHKDNLRMHVHIGTTNIHRTRTICAGTFISVLLTYIGTTNIYPIGNHYHNCCLSSNILNLKSRFRERGKKNRWHLLIEKLGYTRRERTSANKMLVIANERKKGWAVGWRVGERSNR